MPKALSHEFVPLVPGRLLRRDNRFIATIELDDPGRGGREVKAHCTNTGSLMGVVSPGRRVYLRPEAPSPTRRTAFTWVLVRHGRHWVGVDTLLPNRLLYQATAADALPGLLGYAEVRREVPYGTRSRVDLLLSGPGRRDCYVEIKNCHLAARTLNPGIAGPYDQRGPGVHLTAVQRRRFRDVAIFPDAVTARGLKHLRELAREVRRGNRAVLVVVIQRNDCDAFAAAAGIDPEYARTLRQVARQGVEIVAWCCTVSPQRVSLDRQLSVLL